MAFRGGCGLGKWIKEQRWAAGRALRTDSREAGKDNAAVRNIYRLRLKASQQQPQPQQQP